MWVSGLFATNRECLDKRRRTADGWVNRRHHSGASRQETAEATKKPLAWPSHNRGVHDQIRLPIMSSEAGCYQPEANVSNPKVAYSFVWAHEVSLIRSAPPRRGEKKADVAKPLRAPTTSAYSSTSPPARPGCLSMSHPKLNSVIRRSRFQTDIGSARRASYRSEQER